MTIWLPLLLSCFVSFFFAHHHHYYYHSLEFRESMDVKMNLNNSKHRHDMFVNRRWRIHSHSTFEEMAKPESNFCNKKKTWKNDKKCRTKRTDQKAISIAQVDSKSSGIQKTKTKNKMKMKKTTTITITNTICLFDGMVIGSTIATKAMKLLEPKTKMR